jgi:hypothetical protein
MKRFTVPMALIILFLLATTAFAAPAGIFTASSTGQRDFIDPIVSPGTRSAHQHCFYGAKDVQTVETSESLRRKGTTWVETDNHTGVWIPCIYEDGRLLQPATTKHALLYYQPVPGTEQVPPENTGGVTHEVGYRCGTGGGTITRLPPTTCDAGILVVSGFFRAARDFGLTESFPDIRFFIRLNVGKGVVGNITLGGPVAGVDGAAGPETAHADYLWAWDRAAFERFLVNCVRPARACGTNPNV